MRVPVSELTAARRQYRGVFQVWEKTPAGSQARVYWDEMLGLARVVLTRAKRKAERKKARHSPAGLRKVAGHAFSRPSEVKATPRVAGKRRARKGAL